MIKGIVEDFAGGSQDKRESFIFTLTPSINIWDYLQWVMV